MRSKFLKVCFVFLLVFFSLIPSNESKAEELSEEGSMAEELLILVNDSRTEKGLHPLKQNALLIEVAHQRAEELLEKNYLEHERPNGEKIWQLLVETGYKYQRAGENIGVGFTSMQEIHLALIESDSHRKNILNPYFLEIGISATKGKHEGRETIMVVEIFGARDSSEAALKTVFQRRPDLQMAFPDGKNGVGNMYGWTLTQWAIAFGYHYEQELSVYDPKELMKNISDEIRIENRVRLIEVWQRRPDLKIAFPDGKNGVGHMYGWTLTQWAVAFGYHYEQTLSAYNPKNLIF